MKFRSLLVYILFLAPEIHAETNNDCKYNSQAFRRLADIFSTSDCEHTMLSSQPVKDCYNKRDLMKKLASENLGDCPYVDNKVCNDENKKRAATQWKDCLVILEKITKSTETARPETKPGVRPSGTR